MDRADDVPVGWRDVAAAVSGGIAVQTDGAFDFVSEAFAATVGAERSALIGASWREAFSRDEAARLAREAIPAVRDTGRWDGVVQTPVGGGASVDQGALDVTLSTSEDGAIVWVVERDGDTSGPQRRAADGDDASADAGAVVTDDDGDGYTGDGGATEARYRQVGAEFGSKQRFVENVVNALDDVLYVVDEAGEFAFWNDELCDRFGYTDAEVARLPPEAFLRPVDRDELPVESADFVKVPDRHNVVDLVSKDGDAIPHKLHGATYRDETTGERYRVGIARDISDRLARERAIERQRDELATLDRINELLLDVMRQLIQAEDRDVVKRTLCERFASSDLYEFACIGEPEYNSDRIVPEVTAGDDGGYFEEITVTRDDQETGLGPGGRALKTGEVQVTSVEDPSFGPRRAAARERGIETVVAVPIQHDETTFGVLVVYETAERTVTPRERDGFDALGRAVGYVIHAIRQRDLLFADAVVELEFSLAATDSVLTRVATEVGCTLELDGCIPADDAWVLYLSVDGAPPRDVLEASVEDTRVDAATIVTERGTTGRVELVVDAGSIVHAVTEAGTTVLDATVTPEDGRLVVEAPIDTDVRDVVERVRETFPDVRLFARRESTRDSDREVQPSDQPAHLTDRQREVLEAAYHAGYFEWPRECTAEELADSLGMASSTLHGHLRHALQAVVATRFEHGDGDEPDPS